MAMRVYELAKELNITSAELIELAAKEGIVVKAAASNLSDSDVAILKKEKVESKPAPTVIADPVQGKAPARKRPPINRPVINSAFLENRDQAAQEAESKPAEAPANVEPVETKQEPQVEVETKEAPKAPAETKPHAEAAPEAKEVAKEEAKPEAKVEEKKEVKAEEKPEVKVEAKPEAKPEPKPEPKPEAKEAAPPKAKEDAKPAPVQKPREEKPRTDARPDARPAAPQKPQAQKEGFKSRDGQKPMRRAEGRDDKFRPRNERGFDRNADRNADRSSDRSADRSFDRNRQPELPRSERGERVQKGDNRQKSDKKSYDKRDKGQHNKFDKLERKSLEKQTRNKHAKYKNVEIEPVVEEEPIPEGTFVINVPITVAGFCEQTEVSTSKVIMTLMKLGIMANINQNIDEDTVLILAEDLGISVVIGKVAEELEEEGLELFEDDEKDLRPRPPIITVMGHVDHGKTSLLDAIRKTNVTASESGGITQHIGASEVTINGQKIVFLDTPGHEAFTAMRARGAHVTDIAVLVVAADDGVMPQTVESISHAKAAGVPIIVAINKMDKPGANPDRVKQELSEHGILVEEWGGDVISVPVSAKSGDGIVNLLEMILLQAEVLELKANPDRLAMGSVIEARLDKAKGPVATLLVTNGTLESGQSVVAGTCAGRIRLMTDFKGKTIKKAGPATAVEILGLTDVPQAGDEFNAVKEDRIAREIAEHRKEKLREEVLAKNSAMSLEKLFSQIQEGEVKELNLIIKGDVQGSIGALVSSLEKLNNNEVKVNIIHTGVGTVTESDIMLAGTSGAVIIGFNVRPSTAVQSMADRDNIEIRTYRVIYDVIDDVEAAMKGMLDPEFKEEILGKVEIRNTFKVPNVGIVGGAYVTEGKVLRNAEVRLVRDGIVIHEGKISSLKRYKDDAREVNQGYECGIGIENYNDIKEGDIIECFHMVEIQRN